MLRPGTRPLRMLDESDCARLTAHGVNPLQSVRPGAGVAPALRTLARGSGAGLDSSLLTLRRRHLLAINSIEQGTRWARFEGRDRSTWPRLARQVRTFLLGLTASGAFGTGAEMQAAEVVCDERIHDASDLAGGAVHCLVSLPGPRPDTFRSWMITHRLEGTTVRPVRSRQLPPNLVLKVREPVQLQPGDPTLEETAPRRTLAQELFAPKPDQRPAWASALPPPEAAAARRLDLDLIARLHGEPERRGERF
jgi:hypothetical protein